MELLSPAKVNLCLEVTGRRDDGYHELCTLMCCINLFDRIRITPDTTGITVSCNIPGIPEDETNLAARAAKAFFEKTGLGTGVDISIRKMIPAGAGLGGGSSNAASVLNGLNLHYGAPLSAEELVGLAVTIGADVPFFIYSKAAVATGIGEKLVFCENIKHYHMVLLYPGISVSTADVYKNLKIGLTKSEKDTKSRLLNKELVDPLDFLFNDLEAPAFAMCSEIGRLRDLLISFDADGVLMSGSGSSVFGLYAELKNARDAYDKLQTHAKEQRGCENWQVFLTDLIV